MHNYSLIPDLRPVAALICQDQDWTPITGGIRYHLYTDGSAISKMTPKAAWAFHVVVESHVHRLGFTGALLDDRIPEAIPDALDAEATAIIFAADWLLSLPHPMHCVLHFDALAVGYGACGVQHEPAPASSPRPLQHLARVAVCMVQSYHDSVRCHHIKAHSGQPDNEVADSVAHAIVAGWQPPCSPPFRLRALFDHPLCDWAWLEYRPTDELPDIRTILHTKPNVPTLDTSIWQPDTMKPKVRVKQISWKFGTANVRTMAYDNTHHSDKVPLLRAQLQDQAFDVFALQECRGRKDQCLDDGVFIRVCAAGQGGQGGLELWFRKHGAFAQTGCCELMSDQLAVWYASSTVLGVLCQHPALSCNFVVIYGPQSGRPSDEIVGWWTHLDSLLSQRPMDAPMVILGDANAHLGSVIAEGVSDHALEFEDSAGTALRECCSKHDLLLPATFDGLHRGDSGTFIGPRGVDTRVDYIAIPQAWLAGVEFSALCPELDLLTQGADHVAVQLILTMSVQPSSSVVRGRTTRYDRAAAQSAIGQERIATLATCLSPLPWTTDVNDHWTSLRSEVLEHCALWFPKKKRHRRQVYMSPDLWHLVEDRKDLMASMRQMRRGRASRFLAGLFALWKGDRARLQELYYQDVVSDQAYALDLSQYQMLSTRFVAMRREDRAAWYTQCAANLQDGLSRSSLSQWHKLLRPKRAIKQKTNPKSRIPGIRATDGQWLTRGTPLSLMWQRHFGDIENAEDV